MLHPLVTTELWPGQHRWRLIAPGTGTGTSSEQFPRGGRGVRTYTHIHTVTHTYTQLHTVTHSYTQLHTRYTVNTRLLHTGNKNDTLQLIE